MRIATILSAHENSPVYRDTLASVRRYFSDDLVVLVDGFGWNQFVSEDVDKIEGFRHGKPSAPFRNVALGLIGAWERWGGKADWYCYMEYDCLVGSDETKIHLGMADQRDYWMLGNDLRIMGHSMPMLNRIEGSEIKLHYLLGCCHFFSSEFMRLLSDKDIPRRILENTNFFTSDFFLEGDKGRRQKVYDPSEFIYPSLAVHHGGLIEQLACGREDGSWEGNYNHYPMRFRPDLSEKDPYRQACVMHPLKDAESPLRKCHRLKRAT